MLERFSWQFRKDGSEIHLVRCLGGQLISVLSVPSLMYQLLLLCRRRDHLLVLLIDLRLLFLIRILDLILIQRCDETPSCRLRLRIDHCRRYLYLLLRRIALLTYGVFRQRHIFLNRLQLLLQRRRKWSLLIGILPELLLRLNKGQVGHQLRRLLLIEPLLQKLSVVGLVIAPFFEEYLGLVRHIKLATLTIGCL